jgi:hypothetical protein
MKIVSIFAPKLYAIQYAQHIDNEYDRLMELWTDVVYLRQYAKENKISDTTDFIRNIRANAAYIQDWLAKIDAYNESFSTFFRPLHDLEPSGKLLSLQKGKRYKLRLYAIKIEENVFLITGGAIKLGRTMADHPDTQTEKKKLEQVKDYLRNEGVFDSDAFSELITENDDE